MSSVGKYDETLTFTNPICKIEILEHVFEPISDDYLRTCFYIRGADWHALVRRDLGNCDERSATGSLRDRGRQWLTTLVEIAPSKIDPARGVCT